MTKSLFDRGKIDIAWCPGCGNYAILEAVKSVLADLAIPQKHIVFVSGIGQAAKLPQYLKVHYFNGLHGRALPPATGIKSVNPKLTVIAESGDGDMYGEGGNHFIHCIRRNPDITNIVHNNMVYGLTKGQASPTSSLGFHTPIQVNGVILEPFNPLAIAVALDASFVARTFTGDPTHMQKILKLAIQHKGYALVDILQPCVSFNKINTLHWFKEHTYYVDSSYNPRNRSSAFSKALEMDHFPLGVIFQNNRPTFEEQLLVYKKNKNSLITRQHDIKKLQELLLEN
ncbi:MAG: 2-oxoacid ferredoxin oxidoreductase [Candidatus Thermoplasmatota archaeon]|nr:2-oxoacid ferredoxin oxidoreductase [Candidatus Thermoplasmatota archaeon]MBU1941092.1 2-oxoacid ferredoxin oxidoreductase [Candidatus Thermoplasmatota archaeon]